MTSGDLPLPALLHELIASGLWPTTPDAENRQNLNPLAPKERITALAPGEDSLVLLQPANFRTLSVEIPESGSVRDFWTEHGAIDQLEPTLALIIGDFGLGSDTPIVLDYRHEPEPSVLRLEWRPTGDGPPYRTDNAWVTVADSFAEFIQKLGLA